MNQVLGFLGAVLLGLCAAPLLVHTVRDGHAMGVDAWFLGLWLAGELSMLGHVLTSQSTLPVRLNYIANSLMVSVVAWYKWKL